MKHISTLVAVPVLACGAVVAGAAQASASNVDPEPGARGESVVVVPGPPVQVDDTIAEGLEAGASAIGGAGIALAAVWAYRRRHPVAAH